jgi:hypothetical protein
MPQSRGSIMGEADASIRAQLFHVIAQPTRLLFHP